MIFCFSFEKFFFKSDVASLKAWNRMKQECSTSLVFFHLGCRFANEKKTRLNSTEWQKNDVHVFFLQQQ
jgi:hypothetical protein